MTDDPKRSGEFVWGPDDGAIRGPLANNARPMTKPLSPEERVERAWDEEMQGEDLEVVRRAAFLEYFADTHVLVPREPTEEMVGAGVDAIPDFAEGYGDDAGDLMAFAYQVIIAAYESTKTEAD